MSQIKLTECPRDAMQGIVNFIPTATKAAYINLLLKCGFDTIDFGSFVSPKIIPQLRDTAAVLDMLDLNDTRSNLLSIVANYRGAKEATLHQQIKYLGYPFSISETFQQRNTNATVAASFIAVQRIQQLCQHKNKALRVYLSMGFGNPYGDEWNIETLLEWIEKIEALGVNEIYIADTVGVATAKLITKFFAYLNKHSKSLVGVHLHSTPDTSFEKIDAAFKSGCIRFDTVIKGYGGCPMAKDDLTGNIATENVLNYLSAKNITAAIDKENFYSAINYAKKIFKA